MCIKERVIFYLKRPSISATSQIFCSPLEYFALNFRVHIILHSPEAPTTPLSDNQHICFKDKVITLSAVLLRSLFLVTVDHYFYVR